MGKTDTKAEDKHKVEDTPDKEKDSESASKNGKDADQKSDQEEEKKDTADKKDKDDKDDNEEQKPKNPPLYKRPVFIISVSIAVVVLAIGGIILWLILRQYIWTDDAFIDGHVTQVSPQIAARVTALRIRDNQFVHQNELLVELDPTDYQVALEQAKAQVAAAEGRLLQARAQIGSAKAAVAEAAASVTAAQTSFDNASRDLRRYQEVDERARSQQQLDNATTEQKNAQAQLVRAKAGQTSAEANVATAEASVKASEGDLQTAEAGLDKAKVNLSYCEIHAPVDGRVAERTVEVGNFVVTGQALFLLVDPNVWVTANFKETQLTHLRVGQPVTFKVDAYPGQKFQGHVDSLQAGSGSRFSVLPAENATGNYVKVVQRIPVKILFEHDANTNDSPLLAPGMSVSPRVKVR